MCKIKPIPKIALDFFSESSRNIDSKLSHNMENYVIYSHFYIPDYKNSCWTRLQEIKLVELMLPKPVVHSLNPVIGKISLFHLTIVLSYFY